MSFRRLLIGQVSLTRNVYINRYFTYFGLDFFISILKVELQDVNSASFF